MDSEKVPERIPGQVKKLKPNGKTIQEDQRGDGLCGNTEIV